ncbi:unnamed protein product, partial [Dibothriocephalus latus]
MGDVLGRPEWKEEVIVYTKERRIDGKKLNFGAHVIPLERRG